MKSNFKLGSKRSSDLKEDKIEMCSVYRRRRRSQNDTNSSINGWNHV